MNGRLSGSAKLASQNPARVVQVRPRQRVRQCDGVARVHRDGVGLQLLGRARAAMSFAGLYCPSNFFIGPARLLADRR